MAKKNWISVKRGLSEDPKHRQKMGECIWLFLHLVDRADWETGIVYEWRDSDEAIEMGMPLPTMRYQRRKLEENGYITCQQKFQAQDITIHEWVNPRDYSGGVKNKKPSIDSHDDNHGDNVLSPNGDSHDDNHGDNHLDSQIITPSSPSESLSNIKKGDLIDGMRDLYQMPGAKKATVKEYIASILKVRLSLNPSGKDAENFINYAADRKMKDKQTIDKFIDWWLANYQERKYWSFSKMQQNWPAAFDIVSDVEGEEVAQEIY